MNRVQQRILEAVGLLSSNRQHFSSFSKEHTFWVRESKGDVRVPGFVCAQENGGLVLAEPWFRERGLYVSWGTLGGIVLLVFFLSFPLAMPWIYDVEVDAGGVVALSFMAFLGRRCFSGSQ